MRRKLAELDEQIAKARTAREAIDHALRCQHEDILECPNFASLTAARLAGQSLRETHPHQPSDRPSRPGGAAAQR